ncbi:MAG: DNA repair protein RadC [Nitrospirota bacterium]
MDSINIRSIKKWPEEERPRERLIRYGTEMLSDAQLLAIILRTGREDKSALDLANTLLTSFGSLKAIASAGIAELCGIRGIGIAKAAQIKAAFELGGRMLSEPVKKNTPFTSSMDVVKHYNPFMSRLKKEVFICGLLDGKNRLFRDIIISEGSLTASLVHPREVFNPAIRESAASVIVVHNHPSGDPLPSKEDIEITKRLVETGNVIGIKVLDHVIIGYEKHFSFMDERLL